MNELLKIIGDYANIRNASEDEGPVTREIRNKLEKEVDYIETDEIGNLYTLRKGSRPGKILFCAHQDKIVFSNPYVRIGEKDGRTYKFKLDLFSVIPSESPLADIGIFSKEHYFYYDDGKNIPAKIDMGNGLIERMINATQAFMFKSLAQDRLEGFLERNLRIRFPEDVKIEEGTKLRQWPKFAIERNGLVKGKLDDAIGLGIITYLNKKHPREQSPDIVSVFTVQEEIGSKGAIVVSDQLKKIGIAPNRNIVIDTTAFGKLGDGPILYKSCGGIDFDLRFVEELEDVAKKEKLPFKSVNPHAFNDSAVLAFTMQDVATLAVEVPIIGMHSALETVSSADIINTYKLLSSYLAYGDITSLNGVNNESTRKHKQFRIH